MFSLSGEDSVCPCIPDEERSRGGGGSLDEVILTKRSVVLLEA